jgi:cytoplasmic iron level regulating protein YaaA (DUF328/UPF0246 family)
MARFAALERVDRREGLKAFIGMGYGYRSDLSSDREYVFTRVQPEPQT